MIYQILKIFLPFVETIGQKLRPVLQLTSPSDEYNNFQVAFITSQKLKSNFRTDIKIDKNNSDFETTGLLQT